MERTKAFLTLAPLGALVLAVAYLQGYWAVFDVFSLPYLTFQQILSYAAIPFFGILISMGGGWGLGWLGGRTTKNGEVVGEVHDLTTLIKVADLFVVLCLATGAVLLYWTIPGSTFFLCLGFWLLVWARVIRIEAVQQQFKNGARFFELISFGSLAVLLAWALGQTNADRVIFNKHPTATCLLGTKQESVWWIGSLGESFFFLDRDRRVVMIPAKEVSRVVWEKRYWRPSRIDLE